jgi:hypothetical protein
MTPDVCPSCGELVPEGARACPECGADESTGWSERAQAQRLGLPDDEFDYDEFVKEEFGEPKRASAIKPTGLSWVWWLAGILLLCAFLFGLLSGIF